MFRMSITATKTKESKRKDWIQIKKETREPSEELT